MKKTILILAFVFISGNIFAQPIQFGVKGGFTVLSTDIKNEGFNAQRLRSKDTGFSVGAYGRFTMPMTGLYVQPEFMYNHAVYKLDTDQFTGKVKYNNFELPVLVGFKLFFLRANAGPVFNLSTLDKSNNVYNIYRPNVGWAAGIGATLLNKLEIDLRWQGYFGKSKDFNLGYQDLKVKDGFTSITIGYLF